METAKSNTKRGMRQGLRVFIAAEQITSGLALAKNVVPSIISHQECTKPSKYWHFYYGCTECTCGQNVKISV